MDSRERMTPPIDKPFIIIIVKRATIFLLVICAVSLFYWIVGSVSSFLDETQSMLLDVMLQSSLGVVVASGIGLVLSLALAIARRYRLRASGIVGYLAAAAIGTATLALAQSISTLALGLR